MDKDKTEALLACVFALTTIMWCVIFAWVIGEIDKNHKQQIEILEQRCK